MMSMRVVAHVVRSGIAYEASRSSLWHAIAAFANGDLGLHLRLSHTSMRRTWNSLVASFLCTSIAQMKVAAG
jgi:hypothetical protein